MYISSLEKARSLPEKSRKLAVLGSTGSIGRNVLDIVRKDSEKFQILALAGGENVELLAEQANFFHPQVVALKSQDLITELRSLLKSDYRPEIVSGTQGYIEIASLGEVDLVVSALMGAVGLYPTVEAVNQGKVVVLANKESLVLAGPLLKKCCEQSGACILPVDSEHNALFQALEVQNWQESSKLVLTASGGPFQNCTKEFLSGVTPQQALKHPSWDMGAKITIDSATLMNKGLEVIEACHLFGWELSGVEVLIHPESIVHSLVKYRDGSFLAHLGIPDMRIPISYCLTYPQRIALGLKELNLPEIGNLTFRAPDEDKFPCFRLAKEALKAGESAPVVLNAANEVTVQMFLQERITFLDIPRLNQKVLEKHQPVKVGNLDSIRELDAWSRRILRQEIARY